MATIVPSFDFDVDAVPTRATLIEQARSLQVSGLDLLNLDPSITPIVTGATSGATNAMQDAESAVGTLWIDGGGNIWVREASGPVILSRMHGGWETRRYFVNAGSSGLPNTILPGVGACQAGGAGTAEHYARAFGDTVLPQDTARWEANDDAMDNTDSGYLNGFVQETCTSQYVRVCGRGVTVVRDTTNTNNVAIASMRNNYRVIRNDTASLAKESFHGTILSSTKWLGVILSPAHNSSVVSQSSLNHQVKTVYMAWNFGLYQRTREAFV